MANINISDELLAAFLEGNVNEKEMAQVLGAVHANPELRETIDIALQTESDVLPMLQMAAESGRNLCDIQCEAYVLQQHGVDCSVEELLEVAKDKHWIRKAGTPLSCIGNLLKYKGLKVTRKTEATTDDLQKALRIRQGVIVAVDNDKLYPERPDEEDATNHAIVVTDIDPASEIITIYAPEDGIEVDISLPLFISAWKESNFYMVSAQN